MAETKPTQSDFQVVSEKLEHALTALKGKKADVVKAREQVSVAQKNLVDREQNLVEFERGVKGLRESLAALVDKALVDN